MVTYWQWHDVGVLILDKGWQDRQTKAKNAS